MAQAIAPIEIKICVARDESQYARIRALRTWLCRSGNGSGPVESSVDERFDHLPNAVLLLAESTHDGEVLGALRILAGDRGPLLVDERLELPPALRDRSVAEASRLVIRRGPGGSYVRRMLWKAWYRYCGIAQLRTMLACVPESMVRTCERLGMTDVTPFVANTQEDRRNFPGPHLMQQDVAGLRDWMMRHDHPLRTFLFALPHREIDLIGWSEGGGRSMRSMPGRHGIPLPAAAPVAGLAVV